MEILFFVIGTFLIALAFIPILKPIWELWKIEGFIGKSFVLYLVGFILVMILLLGVFIFLG